MIEKIKKTIRFIAPIAIFCALLFVMLKTANAESAIGKDWGKYVPGVGTVNSAGETGEEMAISFVKNGIRIVRYIVGGIALVMGIIFSIGLIFSQGSEDSISKNKKAFIWVFAGFIVLMIGENVADIFNPETSTTSEIIDFNAARDQLRDITQYLKWAIGSIIVLVMTISGVRMITAGGDEETISTEKRNLTWGMLGMLIVLLSSNIVNSIYVINSSKEIISGGAMPIMEEIGGIIKLILIFLGPIAILFTIYAGFMYLTALDNDDKVQKAKTMIVAGVTGIIMIYSAYAIVNTLIGAKLTLLPVINLIA